MQAFGNLEGKTALVCGASQGIGWATAKALAALGARIVMVARTAETLEQRAKELEGDGHEVWVVDLQNLQAIREGFGSWGRGSEEVVHVLVNNSGGPPAGALHTLPSEAFDAPWRQQLLAAHELMRAVLPGMKASGYGRIINVISTSVKAPLRGLGVSNTVRAAVANWSKTLSVELAPWGITVNNVLPGATLTQRLLSIIEVKAATTGHTREDIQKEMLAEIPAGRFGTPEEVAAAVAFLALPSAGYINGIHLPVDGGRTPAL
jgi:3-oxoacyl-[acyl-carrier protein] reductase